MLDFDRLKELNDQSDIQFSFMADTESPVSEGRLRKPQAKIFKRMLKDLEIQFLHAA